VASRDRAERALGASGVDASRAPVRNPLYWR
jgi:hypothetical protein